MTDRKTFVRLAAAAAVATPAVVRAQEAPLLRVASTASDSYAEGLYAQDVGIFKRNGLNIDLQILSNGAAITAAVAAGAIDIGITNVVPLAAAVAHGIPFVYLCSGGTINLDEVALVVAADAPLRNAADFAGKTMASSAITDINTIAIKAWLDQNGGDASKVRFVEIAFSQMAAAVKRGTVDAAPIVEPALSIAKNDGGIRLINPPLYSVFGKTFMVGGWFSTTAWLEKNRETARKFVAAIYETARWANGHPEESSAILAKYAKMDPVVLRTMNRVPYGLTQTPDMLQRALDLAYKYKAVDRPFNARDLIARV